MQRTHIEDWPERLWIVRHGESAGNVARRLAESRGHDRIEMETRDMDVPLSNLGERQSEAVGRWFAETTAAPDAILTSPYLRARRTADLLGESAGWKVPITTD